jgi:hypothetical protein
MRTLALCSPISNQQGYRLISVRSRKLQHKVSDCVARVACVKRSFPKISLILRLRLIVQPVGDGAAEGTLRPKLCQSRSSRTGLAVLSVVFIKRSVKPAPSWGAEDRKIHLPDPAFQKAGGTSSLYPSPLRPQALVPLARRSVHFGIEME